MSKTLTRTVCVMLNVGEHSPLLAETQAVFNKAASWIAGVCWREGITNTNTAHHRVYGETRTRFSLGAQLAVCARAKAMESIKSERTKGGESCPTFGPHGSIRYDSRTYRLMALDRVSLNTLAGRVVCRLLPGDHQHTMLVDPDWRIGGADLVWRDGRYSLHVTQTREAPPADDSGGVLGVDLGQVQLAIDSDGQSFSGGKVKGIRAHYSQRRRTLQKVGTKSARRRLKQVNRKESRFQTDTNHVISKALVAKAAVVRKAIALEDLTGVNEQVLVRRAQRYDRHSWAFSQLRQFLAYKAALAGVPLILVDPAYTSQTCSWCGHCEKRNRPDQATFRCRRCGTTMHADHNAAITIAQRVAVDQPNVGASASVKSRMRRTGQSRLSVGQRRSARGKPTPLGVGC